MTMALGTHWTALIVDDFCYERWAFWGACSKSVNTIHLCTIIILFMGLYLDDLLVEFLVFSSFVVRVSIGFISYKIVICGCYLSERSVGFFVWPFLVFGVHSSTSLRGHLWDVYGANFATSISQFLDWVRVIRVLFYLMLLSI